MPVNDLEAKLIDVINVPLPSQVKAPVHNIVRLRHDALTPKNTLRFGLLHTIAESPVKANVGVNVGVIVGENDGMTEGNLDGANVGAIEGITDGSFEGLTEGVIEGLNDGIFVEGVKDGL